MPHPFPPISVIHSRDRRHSANAHAAPLPGTKPVRFPPPVGIGLIMLLAWLTLAATSARAGITTSGNLTATSGTPYNGTDNPWATNTLTVGNGAPGTLSITGGYVVNNTSTGAIAFLSGASTSTVSVSGAGSKWTNTGSLTVGTAGTGTLTITGGGTVTSTGGIMGNLASGNGTVTVGGGTGASAWTNSSTLLVGNQGKGTLTITGGGTVTNSSSGTIGNGSGSGSNGTVTVGTGSGTGAAAWTLGALTVGSNSAATAVLNLNSGGTVSATALNGGTGANQHVDFNGGTLSIRNTDSAANTINLLAGGGTFDTPTAATTFTITSGISGAGALTKTGQATLELQGANGYNGNTTVSVGTLKLSGTGSIASSPVLTVASGATLDVSGVNGGTNHDGTRFALASGQTLSGGGSVLGPLSIGGGATVMPWIGSATNLNTQDIFFTASNSVFKPVVDFSAAQSADELSVVGTVNINSSTIDLTGAQSLANLSGSETFLLLNNDGSEAINGLFGTLLLPTGYTASLDYAYLGTDFLGRVGDGNDLAVTFTSLNAVPEPSRALLLLAGMVVMGLRRKRA